AGERRSLEVLDGGGRAHGEQSAATDARRGGADGVGVVGVERGSGEDVVDVVGVEVLTGADPSKQVVDLRMRSEPQVRVGRDDGGRWDREIPRHETIERAALASEECWGSTAVQQDRGGTGSR